VFEHALVGYITCQAVRGEPVRLYYAFANEPPRDRIQPYFFTGTIGGVDRPNRQVLGSLKSVVVTFAGVRP
jgi:hypothetical protein